MNNGNNVPTTETVSFTPLISMKPRVQAAIDADFPYEAGDDASAADFTLEVETADNFEAGVEAFQRRVMQLRLQQNVMLGVSPTRQVEASTQPLLLQES